MVDVLLGLQWGDEGKGKIVDFITPHYDVVARFQGGPNAGHTLEFGGIKHVLHTIPSGIFRENTINIVGNGVVIDPVTLKKEIDALIKLNIAVNKKLFISRKAHLIIPTHRLLDAASEALKGKEKIGSTLRGIGPAYMDKTGRNGLRVGDIESPDFISRYHRLRDKHLELLNNLKPQAALVTSSTGDLHFDDLEALEPAFFESIEALRRQNLVDSEHLINRYISENKKILAEGAQGSLLDVDFGSYPYVTSSSTITAGACTGLGISPRHVGKVFGIFKSYCTRVGSGPFPTELHDDYEEHIRKKGNEYGSTTGRPRRTGWLDLPALKYSVMINGVTDLIMMKSDVLSELDEILICTHYFYREQKIDYLPFDMVNQDVQPVFIKMKGWKKNISSFKSETDFPRELTDYIQFIEKETNVPVSIISVGPDRTQTIVMSDEL